HEQDDPIGDSVPVKRGSVVTVGELKQALSAEFQSLERHKAAIDEARLGLGWRHGVHYLRGNTEAGYPKSSGDETLLARTREAIEGEDAAHARAEIHNSQRACEHVADAMQTHNQRLERRGFLAGIFFAFSDYRRAVKLDRQRDAAQQRREAAERDLAWCDKRLETSEQQDRIASL